VLVLEIFIHYLFSFIPLINENLWWHWLKT